MDQKKSEIRYVMNLSPVSKQRPRMTRRGRTYTPEKTVNFENEVKILSKRYAPKQLLEGPLEVRIWFHLERPKKPKNKDYPLNKNDLDNYIKAVFDALSGVMYINDSQICIIEARKLYAQPPTSPRIEIIIESL